MSSVPAWLNSSSFSPRARSPPETPPETPPPPRPPLVEALVERADPLMQAGSSGQQEEATSHDVSRSESSRAEQLQAELEKPRIDLNALRQLATQGIPDSGGIRAVVWKLLLGYLPRIRSQWEEELAKKREQYAQFSQELIVNPSEKSRASEASDGDLPSGGELRRESVEGDHPLASGQASVWHQFFQDTELWEQIDRDVKRTHPDLPFFNGADGGSNENQGALGRILFIFAKLNPGIKYVQGMNEVLAPLLYIFRTDPDDKNKEHAEADAFFCFVELLSDFRDHFCQQLDNSEVGIRATITRLSNLLKQRDEELWLHLNVKIQINPQFYAFRWITLLLTQEFDFPDCLRLWDTLLSNKDGPLEILLRLCCAMVICIRTRLLGGDFTDNLKLLQNYPSTDIDGIIVTADRLRL
ncbi:GTPase-activating protein [Klebsormidium nitens]|uniref:GTPase-activating protein n=1 Tax=Klebsormidium nitens TaxID=105231 RepID=A0A1Y1HS51_KLENI|nr:GTPase-activating protein [Klebsormidium nitens]|eukprot:GAQ80933.1 GTPase-activating protein [Klebsormidium nitens]